MKLINKNNLEEKFEISIDSIASYMIDKGLVKSKSIVDSDLIVSDLSRKNRNFTIVSENSTSYFLKQPYVTDEYSIETINRESKFYSKTFSSKKFSKIQEIIPKFIEFDSKNNILITKFISNYQKNNEKEILFAEQMSALGKSLGMFHSFTSKKMIHSEFDFLPKSFPPTILISHPSPELFSLMGLGSLQFLKDIQQNKILFRFLVDIEKIWCVETIIHGDLKFDNVIFTTSETKKDPELKLLDWELVNRGDPAWDIGTILFGFLYSHLFGEDFLKNFKVNENFDQVKSLIQTIGLDFKVLWKVYQKEMKQTKLIDKTFLDRAIKYATAKLIQSSFDSLQEEVESSDRELINIKISETLIKNIDLIKHILINHGDSK
ncbi:MAG: phosphotransferase [Nitrosopumilus sp.]|nr:phosphotransferase [Nitrosopumilus sp.]